MHNIYQESPPSLNLIGEQVENKSEEEGCGEDYGAAGGQCQVFSESPPPVDSISATFVIE